MRSLLLRVACILVLASACSTQVREEAVAQQAVSPPAANCTDERVLSQQVRETNPVEQQKAAGVVWSSWSRLAESREVQGPCAPAVVGFGVSGLLLEQGVAFGFTKANLASQTAAGVRRLPSVPSSFNSIKTFDELASPSQGAVFDSAVQIEVRRVGDVLYRDYLGLWQTPTGSVLAAFTVPEGSRPSAPREVATSRLRIESVGFILLADWRGGTFYVLQKPDPLHTLATTFQVSYEDWVQR